MHAPGSVLYGRRRPPPPALRSRCAHASAAAESPERCQASFTRRRCCRGEVPPLSGVVHLLSCLYISSPMLSYTVGELVDTLQATPAPPEITVEERFKTGTAFKKLGGSMAEDTALAFKKIKRAGIREINGILERTRPVSEVVKKGAHLAYRSVGDTSVATARALRRAARKTQEAARKTWRAVLESPREIWRHTGRGVKRLGTWMLEGEESNEPKMNEVSSDSPKPQNASTD